MSIWRFVKGDLRIGAQPKLMTTSLWKLAAQLIAKMEVKHPETQVKDNLGSAIVQEPFF